MKRLPTRRMSKTVRLQSVAQNRVARRLTRRVKNRFFALLTLKSLINSLVTIRSRIGPNVCDVYLMCEQGLIAVSQPHHS